MECFLKLIVGGKLPAKSLLSFTEELSKISIGNAAKKNKYFLLVHIVHFGKYTLFIKYVNYFFRKAGLVVMNYIYNVSNM